MSQSNPRERIGLDDFVLLDNYDDQEEFIENLRIRHRADIIYVDLFFSFLF